MTTEARPLTDDEFQAFLKANARNTATNVILDHINEVWEARRHQVSLRKIAELLSNISGIRIDPATLRKVLSNPDDSEKLTAEMNMLLLKRRNRDLIRQRIQAGSRMSKTALRELAAEETLTATKSNAADTETMAPVAAKQTLQSVPSPISVKPSSSAGAGQCLPNFRAMRKETEANSAALAKDANATLADLFGKTKKVDPQQEM